MDTIEQSIREETHFALDYRTAHPDGTIKYIHAVGHPVLNASGDLVEFMGASIDMTERKRAEAEARESERRRREAQAELAHITRVTTLGELTASIAHEVNQPLAAVLANAEACLLWLNGETPDLDGARRSVEWIIQDGNRAGEVIRRVRGLLKSPTLRRRRSTSTTSLTTAFTWCSANCSRTRCRCGRSSPPLYYRSSPIGSSCSR
jgi:C4-dicarboxylate-specific signal transduction histidine kinase